MLSGGRAEREVRTRASQPAAARGREVRTRASQPAASPGGKCAPGRHNPRPHRAGSAHPGVTTGSARGAGSAHPGVTTGSLAGREVRTLGVTTRGLAGREVRTRASQPAASPGGGHLGVQPARTRSGKCAPGRHNQQPRGAGKCAPSTSLTTSGPEGSRRPHHLRRGMWREARRKGAASCGMGRG